MSPINRILPTLIISLHMSVSDAFDLTEEYCQALPQMIAIEEDGQPIGISYRDSLQAAMADKADEKIGLEDLSDFYLLAGLYFHYGQCLLQGVGFNADSSQAEVALLRADELGHPSALHILASLKVFKSEDKDEQLMGVEMLRLEMDEGSKFAAGKLGWAYHGGYGVEKNDKKALELYEVSAAGGMTLWQFVLAHSYEMGYYGLPQDSIRRDYWIQYKPKVHVYTYECAVAQLYHSGRSFPPNPEVQEAYEERCNETANKTPHPTQ